MHDTQHAGSGATARLALALALGALVAAVSVLRSGPPPVVPADSPPEVASGARALEFLARLAPGSAPRPVGSEANAALRARLVEELQRLGLEVEVQETFALRVESGPVVGAVGAAVGGVVRNVVARRRGRAAPTPPGERHALLCMAHYDSVGAGPGVSDDLAGVAAWLEVARALRAGDEPLVRDLVFLFSDGEEAGLLGAEAFVAQHRWAADVGAVINLEARGTDGPSRMFETGADNDWIAAAFARGATRPSATSLSTEVYRRMPNDTDYTVFRRRGIPGLNFAWIGGVSRYHTPLDDMAHLDARSLQHHVTNAMDAVRALGATAWRAPGQGRGDAVFADLLGWRVLLLGENTARALALGALLLALVGVVRASRAGSVSGGRVLVGVVMATAVGALVLVAAHGAGLALEAVAGVPRPWRAHPAPAVIGLVGAGLAATAFAAPLAARAATIVGLGLGGSVVLGAATLLAALVSPGSVVVLLAPALALALGAACARYRGDGTRAVGRSALVAACLALVLLAPLGAALVDAFGCTPPAAPGPPLGAAIGALVGLWALVAAPLFAAAGASMRLAALALGGVATVFAAVMVAILPATTLDAPGHLSFVYAADHDTRIAEWHLASGGDPVPDAVLALGTFGEPRVRPSWSQRHAGAAPAPEALLPFPELEDLSVTNTPDGRVATATVRSHAGGHELDLRASGIVALEVEGVVVPHGVRLVGVRPEGYQVRALLSDEGALDGGESRVPVLRVVERVLGPAPRSEHFVAARPPERTPAHRGDGALLLRRFALDAARPLPMEEGRADERAPGAADPTAGGGQR